MAECGTSVLEDPRRLDAVRRAGLLDTPAEPGFDRLTKLASRLLKAPIALFSLLDAGRQYFKSTLGVPAPWGPGVNVPIDHSICKYTLEGQPLIVKDLREDPTFAQGLFKGNGLIRKLGLGAYLGVPVTTEDGLCIGTLCVVDHRARDWTTFEVDTLRKIAASVMTEIELRVARLLFQREQRYSEGQTAVFELIARGGRLPVILERLIQIVEVYAPGMLGSVLLYEEKSNRLVQGAAPSLPASYMKAIDGTPPGPCAGSCGTAAFLNARVIVEDIPNDPRWADYRELARQAGVQSCWSEPIKDPGGHLLGTFAMYYREIRAPRDWELKVIGRAAQIAGVAILRERVDQAIQLSEAHFRRLADAVPELVWSTDAAGQRDYHNERWLRYTGQSAKEALRGGWKAVLHPDDLARAQQAWQTALTAGQRFDVEYRLKNRTGQYRWHSTHVAPFRDEEGHIVKWFGTSIDIEDAKRAQLEREERSRQLSLDLKRLEAIVSQLPEGVMVEDAASGELTFRNAEVEHLLGQPLLAGDLKQAWMQQRSHASEAPALQEEWPLARAIRHGKATGAQEIEVVRQDGTRATLSCRAAPIRDEESNIVAGVITLTDVTESKRLKDEQQLLANVSRVLNSSLDFNETITQLAQLATNTIADGCVIDVVDGDAIRRVATAHREPRREDLLRELQERFAADWQSTRPAVEALRTGRAVLHSELTPEVRAHFAVNAAHGGLLEQLDARSVLCVPLICRDMTLGVITLFFTSAHKRFTQRDIPLASEIAYRAAVALDNARLYQQAQKAVRLRDEFMSIASHELKAPLTALKIQAFLSRRQFQANVAATPAGTQTTKLLDTFDRQIDRLTRLIDDMLDVSRLTTGHLTLQWEHFDACELAAEVLDRFSAQLAQTGGEARCISTEPIIGRWDRHRLDQVLTNLISNAIKYAPGKPIEVRVSGDAEKAWVEVRDFGPGLSPEDSERIFQRFERLAPGKSTGLGLGLYIARQIVEALNGRLWVDSQLGYGSKFIMELPRR